MKIVCIGNAAYDQTFEVSKYPRENSKMRSLSLTEGGGGPAYNAAYFLGKWGIEVYFLGLIGNDIYGQKIKKQLEVANVNTNYVEVSNDYQTPIAHILINTKKKTRTVVTHRMKKNMKRIQLPFSPDMVLMDGEEYDVSKDLLEKYPAATFIMDAEKVTTEVLYLSRDCDYVICSKDFAEELTGMFFDFNKTDIITTVMKNVQREFKGNVIITLGEMGCLYIENDKVKRMPTMSVDSLDTTGAGDIFHATFVYGLAKKLSFEKTILLSTITATLSTKKMGVVNSVPTKKEVRDALSELK